MTSGGDRAEPHEPVAVDIGFEDSLPLNELLLDLGIARQAPAPPVAESLGGLALGQCEVPNAVLAISRAAPSAICAADRVTVRARTV